MRTLPDLLSPGLDLVFVGINPSSRSARIGHYYGHPGNRFWRALSISGLTCENVTPCDDRRLPTDYKIGFTDIVKRIATDSNTITTDELRRSAPAFRKRIAYARPHIVCFTNTRAFSLLFPGIRQSGEWGSQPVTLDNANVWLMPSTSGRASSWRTTVDQVFSELALTLERAHDVRLGP